MMVVLFSTASFRGIVTISIDRFFALHFHLRYQELVTHKRVVAVIISICLYSALLSPMALWGTAKYSVSLYIHRYCHWSSFYNTGLHQDLFGC